MIKNSAIKRIITSSLALVITLLICIFPSGNKEKAIYEEVVYIDEITLPIYAPDSYNYVARTKVIKNDDDTIKYIITTLTKGSISANLLPSGFSAIIPQNTKLLEYSINEDLLKIDFSKEFLNVPKEDEEKLIESLIYSLCEIDKIDKIMIFVEGKSLLELPNSKKKLPLYLDKSYGINKKYDFTNVKSTSKATIYYASKYNNNLYYVPITKITNSTLEPVEVIVSELKSSSLIDTNLISYLNASFELKDYEILENSINLSFNNKSILGVTPDDIIEKVKYSLSLSLMDTYNIKDVFIDIN